MRWTIWIITIVFFLFIYLNTIITHGSHLWNNRLYRVANPNILSIFIFRCIIIIKHPTNILCTVRVKNNFPSCCMYTLTLRYQRSSFLLFFNFSFLLFCEIVFSPDQSIKPNGRYNRSWSRAKIIFAICSTFFFRKIYLQKKNRVKYES